MESVKGYLLIKNVMSAYDKQTADVCSATWRAIQVHW